MEILNRQGTKEIYHKPFDIKSIQYKGIYSDKIHMLIPIQDEDILKTIEVEEDAMIQNEFAEPRFSDDILEVSLYIDMESENFNVCLVVKIPRQRNTSARVYPIKMKQEEESQLMWELFCLV